MEWFEYLIIAIAIGLVILPIFLSIRAKKKGQISCRCSCNGCPSSKNCCNNIDQQQITKASFNKSTT